MLLGSFMEGLQGGMSFVDNLQNQKVQREQQQQQFLMNQQLQQQKLQENSYALNAMARKEQEARKWEQMQSSGGGKEGDKPSNMSVEDTLTEQMKNDLKRAQITSDPEDRQRLVLSAKRSQDELSKIQKERSDKIHDALGFVDNQEQLDTAIAKLQDEPKFAQLLDQTEKQLSEKYGRPVNLRSMKDTLTLPFIRQIGRTVEQQRMIEKDKAEEAEKKRKEEEHKREFEITQKGIQQRHQDEMRARERAERRLEKLAAFKEEEAAGGGRVQETRNAGAIQEGYSTLAMIKPLLEMEVGQTGSLTAAIHGGTLATELAKVGTTALSTEESQVYDAAIGGLAAALARSQAALIGRSPSDSQINELKAAYKVPPGTPKVAAFYKKQQLMAELKQVMKAASSKQPRLQQEQKEVIEYIDDNSVPPEYVAKQMRTQGVDFKKLISKGPKGESYGEMIQRILKNSPSTEEPKTKPQKSLDDIFK